MKKVLLACLVPLALGGCLSFELVTAAEDHGRGAAGVNRDVHGWPTGALLAASAIGQSFNRRCGRAWPGRDETRATMRSRAWPQKTPPAGIGFRTGSTRR